MSGTSASTLDVVVNVEVIVVVGPCSDEDDVFVEHDVVETTTVWKSVSVATIVDVKVVVSCWANTAEIIQTINVKLLRYEKYIATNTKYRKYRKYQNNNAKKDILNNLYHLKRVSLRTNK